MQELVAQWLSEKQVVSRVVRSALRAEETWCRYLEFPPLSGRELEVAVPSMAQKYVPLPLDEVTLHHVAVRPLGTEKKSAIFVVAARRDRVQVLRQLIVGCGLEMERLDVAPLALAREFYRNHATAADEVCALIHVGFRSSLVVVVCNGCPYYVRSFWPAATDMVAAVHDDSMLSWEAAQRYLLSTGVKNVDAMLEPMLIRWMGEVRRTLQHGDDLFVERKMTGIRTVWLSGGIATLSGLDFRLSEFLGLPVAVDHWEKIAPLQGATDRSPVFKVALGAALID